MSDEEVAGWVFVKEMLKTLAVELRKMNVNAREQIDILRESRDSQREFCDLMLAVRNEITGLRAEIAGLRAEMLIHRERTSTERIQAIAAEVVVPRTQSR